MQDETKSLAAQALAADPRLEEAKRLLLDTVTEHQKSITGVRPADPQLKLRYNEMLAAFAECRGGKLWFPYLGSGLGKGALVELLDGSVKYDFISGIGVHYLGHNHPALIRASIDAALSNTIMQGHLQQNADGVELSLMLAQAANMPHCFLASSGAMANENALKLAFQKRFPATRVLAFERCFAGRTLSLSQITDKPAFREGLPMTLQVDYVPFYNAMHPEESTERAVSVLKKHLARYPKQHAVMCFELVQGENGSYPGSREFFVSLMRILKEHNISILIDEVQTFGRLPELFAFQYFGLQEYADLVPIGKLSQVCATLFNDDHKPKPGLLSQTFTSSTAAIRSSIVILQELLQGHFFGPQGKNQHIFEYFSKKLQEISFRHPEKLTGPFGIGAMIAFTPFGGDPQRATNYIQSLFEAGVLSFIAGESPKRVRFLVPAGAVTMADIDAVSKILEDTLIRS